MGEVDLLLLTFNCGRELAKPEVFAAHIVGALATASAPNIIVFSLQEVAPIAYSFLGGSFLDPYLARFRHTVDLVANAWNENHGDNHHFVTLAGRNVGMTAIIVFARDDVAHRFGSLESGGVGVGWYRTGNKGCVGVRLGYATDEGILELTFLAAHLAPMEWALGRRNEDWANIVRGLVFTPTDTKGRRTSGGTGEEEPLLQGNSEGNLSGIYTKTSHVFIAGDLNYRTSDTKPSEADEGLYPQPVEPSNPKHFKNLLPKDQLRAQICKNKTLHGFHEFPIDFPPTYKYSDLARSATSVNEEQITEGGPAPEGEPSYWAWSNHRWPSWCDRILYLDVPSQDLSFGMKVHRYTSLPLMSTSDHRPVVLSLYLPTKPLSLSGDSDSNMWRNHPPFRIDPDWREKRTIARTLEIGIGISSYLALTWEGNGILLALAIGSLGGWAALGSMVTK